MANAGMMAHHDEAATSLFLQTGKSEAGLRLLGEHTAEEADTALCTCQLKRERSQNENTA